MKWWNGKNLLQSKLLTLREGSVRSSDHLTKLSKKGDARQTVSHWQEWIYYSLTWILAKHSENDRLGLDSPLKSSPKKKKSWMKTAFKVETLWHNAMSKTAQNAN